MLKEILLGLFLLVAIAFVVYGVSLLSVPVAFILAGVGIAGLGWYFLVEVG